MLTKCKIALSCRREADFHDTPTLKKKEKKMCPFRYHFGGTRLKKCASRVGATQIRKNGHKQIISFYRVEASWKSASRLHESAILQFGSIKNVDFYKKSTSPFWAWHAGKTWNFMIFLLTWVQKSRASCISVLMGCPMQNQCFSKTR